MKYKMLVGLLVASLVLTSTTTVQAQTISVPAWVSSTTNIAGWNMVYNGSLTADLDLASTKVKTNWTQLFIKNSSTTVLGIVGVVTIEYTEDFFSKTIANLDTFKTTLATYFPSLPAFTGTTVWDFFNWTMGLIAGAMGTVTVNEKNNIPNANGAFSLNLTTFGEGSFYLLYAYKGTYAMMVFAMNFEWDLSTLWGYYEAGNTAIQTWFNTYVVYLVSAFGTIMTAFANMATGLGVASIPATAGLGSITPTAGGNVETSSSDVNALANAFAGALPGGIPGYPVLLVGIASLFAVLVIVQKKRKAIVA